MKIWVLLRDVLLTGTGIFIAVHEAFSPRPSDALLVLALALTAPSFAEYGKAILGGPGSRTSGSSSEHGSSSSSPSPEEQHSSE